MNENLRFIIFEDEDLLVINKPAGISTHSATVYSACGIYDWLRVRRAEWGDLSIIHRLDKETSGVLVFSKTTAGNRSLTKQFKERLVKKKYVLLTDRKPPSDSFNVVSHIRKVYGSIFMSEPLKHGLEPAETRFRVPGKGDARLLELCAEWIKKFSINSRNDIHLLIAEPVTGRTHQVRLHAAQMGCPVLGDNLYGGTPSTRLWLHSIALSLRHPTTDELMEFVAPAPANELVAIELRQTLINDDTNVYRLIHGAADNAPGLYIDRFGDWLLAQSEQALTEKDIEFIKTVAEKTQAKGVYHKLLIKQVRQHKTEEVSPKHILGEPAPTTFIVQENGVKFEVTFKEGYSTGLFLDQRENRRKVLVNLVKKNFRVFPYQYQNATLLNTFAYTCGFSVCAAIAGVRTVSVDLSAKYLEWGKRNFKLNNLDPQNHEFLKGDVFSWFKRFIKRGRVFDVIILDPPTFSQSRESGVFQAYKDYPELLSQALHLLNTKGVLFASLNTSSVEPEKFVEMAKQTVEKSGRKILRLHFEPQSFDFPSNRELSAYLKTLWIKIK